MRLPLTLAAAAIGLAFAGAAAASPADDAIAKVGCHKCHTEKTTKKAPSWASLAEKYKGNADAPNKLFKELKAGGKVGDEDDHKKIDADDATIKAVVETVLSSK